MVCIISIQYPCRYDRILPLAIHHPELAEVGLGRARVLRLPVGRVTRDTWHHTRDIIHVWHVTFPHVTRAAPGTTSGGVLAPSTATASTASYSPRCATETRIARTTWEPELQTIHRQSCSSIVSLIQSFLPLWMCLCSGWREELHILHPGSSLPLWGADWIQGDQ